MVLVQRHAGDVGRGHATVAHALRERQQVGAPARQPQDVLHHAGGAQVCVQRVLLLGGVGAVTGGKDHARAAYLQSAGHRHPGPRPLQAIRPKQGGHHVPAGAEADAAVHQVGRQLARLTGDEHAAALRVHALLAPVLDALPQHHFHIARCQPLVCVLGGALRHALQQPALAGDQRDHLVAPAPHDLGRELHAHGAAAHNHNALCCGQLLTLSLELRGAGGDRRGYGHVWLYGVRVAGTCGHHAVVEGQLLAIAQRHMTLPAQPCRGRDVGRGGHHSALWLRQQHVCRVLRVHHAAQRRGGVLEEALGVHDGDVKVGAQLAGGTAAREAATDHHHLPALPAHAGPAPLRSGTAGAAAASQEHRGLGCRCECRYWQHRQAGRTAQTCATEPVNL
mmetsp:Transcript_21440/g.54997  ORF Transcript_21440/g.54997 Transcript_21440/m.54997 type:complete len:393 (-) Transcript_21440:21-1199(-)